MILLLNKNTKVIVHAVEQVTERPDGFDVDGVIYPLDTLLVWDAPAPPADYTSCRYVWADGYELNPAYADLFRPVLVITDIASDSPASLIDMRAMEVTTPVGSTVTATVELHSHDGQLLPFSGAFRMPVSRTDGRQILALASFAEGVSTIAIKFEESGLWRVSKEGINSALPDNQQMDFAGISIYVVQ